VKPGAGGIEDIGGCGKAHVKNVGLWHGVGNGSLKAKGGGGDRDGEDGENYDSRTPRRLRSPDAPYI